MKCIAGSTSECRPKPAELSRAIKSSSTEEFSQTTLATRYVALLQRLSPDVVQSADKNIVEYAYPYLHLLAVEVFARLQLQSFLLERQYYEGVSVRAQTEALEEGWAMIHDTLLYMTNTQKSISRFATSKSPQSAELLRDYDALLGQIHLVQDDLRDYVSRHLGTLTLEESKKSIEQADVVKRLTVLAFVFIPLNFVTSAFGMNLTALGSGNAELWMFFATSVSLGFVIFVLAFWALRDTRRTAREFGVGKPTVGFFRTVRKLSKISLTETFWLLLFASFNTSDDTAAYCDAINTDYLGEWRERDHNDYPSRQPVFEFPALLVVGKRPFWERHAIAMNTLLTSRKARLKGGLSKQGHVLG